MGNYEVTMMAVQCIFQSVRKSLGGKTALQEDYDEQWLI